MNDEQIVSMFNYVSDLVDKAIKDVNEIAQLNEDKEYVRNLRKYRFIHKQTRMLD